MPALLDVEDLRVLIPSHGGDLYPVRGISFAVASGQTLAILGESGCGKSMTSRAIMRLLPRQAQASAQRLHFDGEALLDLPIRRLNRLRGRRLAMIFQDPSTALNPCYTIGNQMAEVLREHEGEMGSVALRRACEMLERVGIAAPAQRLRQYPHQLSGGMRQRVAIAMALLCRPELLIADEPITALDVTMQAQVLRLLKSLQQESGMALVLITHDLGVAASMADTAVVMYNGQCVESGPVRALFRDPLHPYTEGLLHAIPGRGVSDADARLGTIPGFVPRVVGELAQCGFLSRCPYAQPACAVRTVPLQPAEDGLRASRCLLDGARARDARVWREIREEAA